MNKKTKEFNFNKVLAELLKRELASGNVENQSESEPAPKSSVVLSETALTNYIG